MSQHQHAVSIPQTNGIGMAGFICSIVGLFTGGLLSPIGLILSLVGLGKEPKGFAIAGVIIGLIGSCGIILAFMIFGAAILAALGIGIAAAVAMSENENFEISSDMLATAAAVANYEHENGQLPADLSLLNLKRSRLIDPWGNEYQYHFVDAEDNDDIAFDLVSAGEDLQFGTDDDVKLSALGETWEARGPGFNMHVQGGDEGGTVLMKIGDKTLEVIGGDDGGHIVLRDGDKVIEIEGGDEGGSINIGEDPDDESSDAASEDAEADTEPPADESASESDTDRPG